MADELVNGTQGHENESVNVAGLKATIKDAGNLGIFNKGTCSTAASTAAKTVTVGSAFALEEDALVLVRFANEVTSENSTLSVNNSTAKPIYYRGSALEPKVIKADSECIMRYDGTSWNIIGGMSDKEVEIGSETPVEDVKLFVDEDEDPAGAINIYNKTQVDTLLEGKVDKETGKGLSTNDYTTNEKNKLGDIPSDSKTAAIGGTDLSLVTTGEKAVWNGKYALPSGGTSSQFIKGDGTLDSNQYLPLTGGSISGSVYFHETGSNSPNGEYARLVCDSGQGGHKGGVVLQLGQDSGAYNRFEVVDSQWSKAQLIVQNNGGVFIGGQRVSQEIITPNTPITSVVYTNADNTFPFFVGNTTKGITIGVDGNGDPTVGTYGDPGTDFDYLRIGGRVKVDTGLEIFNLGMSGTATPYIDFHFNNDDTEDYSSRIIEEAQHLLNINRMLYVGNPVTGPNFVGIGTTDSSYVLNVGGAAAATSFVNTSDIRKKDIIENLDLDVEDIANAPLFKFSWLDPDMPEGVNVGTSAQYWQTILPEIVSEANDDEKTLSMQYGVAGLASSIALARKVVEQENIIKAQEARIKALENAIAEIQNKLK